MSSPEVARLTRRVDEDLRVISDTVLDVKDRVDQHTEQLQVISTAVLDLKGTVDQHTEHLQVISTAVLDLKGTVDQHTEVLGEHGGMLVEILRRLEPAS
jgi:methyl-accepting chemotaxis protein